MSLLSKIAIVAAAVTEVNANQVAKGGDMCARAPSWDQVQLAYIDTAAGDQCTGTTFPSTWVEQKLIGLGSTKGTKTAYITDPTQRTAIDASTDKGDGKTHYQILKEESKTETTPAISYSYVMAGTAVGTVSEAGTHGFVGTASYFVTSGSAKFKENKFRGPSDDSTEGDESPPICVVQIASDRSCPDANGRTVSAGDYKFSLYGYTAGNSFEASAADFTNLGFRTTVKFENFLPSVNGTTGTIKITGFGPATSTGTDTEVDLANIPATGITGVTGVVIKGKSELRYGFPLIYNVGVIGDTKPTHSRTVHINIVKNDATSFHVDYLFDMQDLNKKDRWFVYDPDMKVAAPGGTTAFSYTAGTTDPAGGAAASGAMGMGLSGLVMMVFGFLMM